MQTKACGELLCHGLVAFVSGSHIELASPLGSPNAQVPKLGAIVCVVVRTLHVRPRHGTLVVAVRQAMQQTCHLGVEVIRQAWAGKLLSGALQEVLRRSDVHEFMPALHHYKGVLSLQWHRMLSFRKKSVLDSPGEAPGYLT